MKQLFAKLGAMYGKQKWDAFIGNEKQYRLVFAAWVDGLQEYADEQIERGLRNLSEKGEPWIPALPEFQKLCLTESGHWQQKTAAYRDDALKKLKQDKENAKLLLNDSTAKDRVSEHRRKLREALNKPYPHEPKKKDIKPVRADEIAFYGDAAYKQRIEEYKQNDYSKAEFIGEAYGLRAKN